MVDTLVIAKNGIKICAVFCVDISNFVIFASIGNLNIVIIICSILGGSVACCTVR